MIHAIRRGALALLVASASALAFFGCSPTLATPSSHSADPSSPSAPAGRSPLDAVPEAAATPGASAAKPNEHAQHDHAQHGHGHDHGAPSAPTPAGSTPTTPTPPKPATPKNAAAIYACPMHPEVRSNAPALCPKCNMKLEKQP